MVNYDTDDAIRFGSYPSIAKLAKKAEVNERTIERDIEYLRDMYEAPIEYDRQWYETQAVEQLKDGLVHVKLTTTQRPEVLRWVLGQGRTVRVLGPKELIGMVKEEVELVRGMYG